MTEVIKVEDCNKNIGDYDIPIHNAIIIPKGATNGDLLTALTHASIKNYAEYLTERGQGETKLSNMWGSAGAAHENMADI